MNAVDELNFLLGIGPPRPQLPLTLQRSGYTSVRALGKGSFGQAFLVFHKERGQYFVVKHVNMTNMTLRQRKDAHNEISVLQQLYHPNIVRYVEYFEEHPHLYIVMEYADGGDLCTHLTKIGRLAGPSLVRMGISEHNNGLLTEPQVISLFVQTTMAVKYMHDRRLLHRDIKSQNVFLTRNHVVKLGDFGITTVLQSTMAMASTMCGTPCYFSPELCQGRPYNNKSDVWALGVLLYELCAGTLPFESTTMKALMREIVSKHPKRIPSSFSNELWKLIQWMLEKDPKKRPDAGQVLMQPVLMRRVPDIITQLKSAVFNDISPRARDKTASPQQGKPSPSSHASPNHGNGNPGNILEEGDMFVADTEPYRQLLAQAQRESANGKQGGAGYLAFLNHANASPLAAAGGGGTNPFKGALPPGNPTGGYTSNRVFGSGERLSPPRPDARPGGENDPHAGKKRPSLELTPGQKAAQDVLQRKAMEQQHGKGGEAGQKATPPAKTPATAADGGKANANRRPISDLLAKFDAEKKRISDSKNAAAGAGAVATGDASSTPEKRFDVKKREKGTLPKLPPLLSKAEMTEAQQQAAAAAGGVVPPTANGGNILFPLPDKHGQTPLLPTGPEQRAKDNKELDEMLKEMTDHFEVFASARMAKPGEVIALPGPPPSSPSHAPQPPSAGLPPSPPPRRSSAVLQQNNLSHEGSGNTPRAGGKSARPSLAGVALAPLPKEEAPGAAREEKPSTPAAVDFSDPNGAALDVATLQSEADAFSLSSRQNNGEKNNFNAEKVFTTSINKRFDRSAQVRKASQATPPAAAAAASPLSPRNTQAPPGKPAHDAKESDTANPAKDTVGEDIFVGTCACGTNTLSGSLSLIFGSFLCSCPACSRHVSCEAMGGIEWLHLPNVPAFLSVYNNSNGGASAAQPLQKGHGKGDQQNAAAEKEPFRTYAFKALVEEAMADTDADSAKNTPQKHTAAAAADGGGAVLAPFVKYFCARCGGTLAMQHGGLEGLLIPKTALTADSLALLDRFAITVLPDA